MRHQNSKTNEPKFWQILSPKNSFAKTSSALFRHLPEYLEGRTPKKNVLSFLEEIGRAQIRKVRNIFLWCPPRLCEAVAGLIHSSSFRSKKVRAKCIITASLRKLQVLKVRLAEFIPPEAGLGDKFVLDFWGKNELAILKFERRKEKFLIILCNVFL
ncbi:MAG: hypothetical protein Q7S66_06180 [bacterium]|nr:hypothetical protein [bacterium]